VPDEPPGRRETLTVKAFDPATGGDIDVYISYERQQAVGPRSLRQIKEAAERRLS
jgi:hypothetical protein